MAEYISFQSHGCSFYGCRVERMRAGLACICNMHAGYRDTHEAEKCDGHFSPTEMNGFGFERAELIAGHKLLRHRSRGELVFYGNGMGLGNLILVAASKVMHCLSGRLLFAAVYIRSKMIMSSQHEQLLNRLLLLYESSLATYCAHTFLPDAMGTATFRRTSEMSPKYYAFDNCTTNLCKISGKFIKCIFRISGHLRPIY